MIEYEILESSNTGMLETKVTNYLKTGYVCTGGVGYANGRYFQPMVKEKKDERKDNN